MSNKAMTVRELAALSARWEAQGYGARLVEHFTTTDACEWVPLGTNEIIMSDEEAE
jgi:hypothetical protein